jgi:hypothetical protein
MARGEGRSTSSYVSVTSAPKTLLNMAQGTRRTPSNVQNVGSMNANGIKKALVNIIRTGNDEALKQIADNPTLKEKYLITTRFEEKYPSTGNKTLLHYALEQYVKDPSESRKMVFLIIEKRIAQLNEEKKNEGIKSRIMPFALDDDKRHLLHTYALHSNGMDAESKEWLMKILKMHLDSLKTKNNNNSRMLGSFQHALKTPTKYNNKGFHTVRNILHNKGFHNEAQKLTPAKLKNEQGRITNISMLNRRSHTNRATLMQSNGKTPLFVPPQKTTIAPSTMSAVGRNFRSLTVNNAAVNGEVQSARRTKRSGQGPNTRPTKLNTRKNNSVQMTNTGSLNLTPNTINKSLNQTEEAILYAPKNMQTLGSLRNAAQKIRTDINSTPMQNNTRNFLKNKANTLIQLANIRMR